MLLNTTNNRSNRKKRTRKGKKMTIRWAQIFLLIFLSFAIVVGGVGAGVVGSAMRDMPEVEEVLPQTRLTSYVYDKDGNEISPLKGPEHRIHVDIEDVPDVVKDAFMAIEDHRFYDHFGLDVYRIAGAFWTNITTGSLQGASTITQQLARNAWPIGMEQTYSRKIQEAFLAMQLERTYTKNQIFEMYLNQINLGHNAYGVQAAAEIYFDKDIADVTLSEAAMLAALPRAPSHYSPYIDPERAEHRRQLVLEAMYRYDKISEAEKERAQQESIQLSGLPTLVDTHETAPFFMDYVLDQLLKRYNPELVYGGGLRVYTTLDLDIQSGIDDAVAKHLDENFPVGEFEKDLQVAAVVMDPYTGHIKGMRGGREHTAHLEHNRVSQSYRQPGSVIKPIGPYAAALDQGWSPGSIIDDAPVAYSQPDGRFIPRNYSEGGSARGLYRGLTTMREAIRRSVNVTAVRTMDQVGIGTVYDMLKRFGITSLDPDPVDGDHGLAAALGGLSKGVSPLELTAAYAAFPGGGVRPEPIAITKVVDRHGNVLEDNTPDRSVVMEPDAAYLMLDMLKSVIRETRTGWISNWDTGYRAQLEGDWPAGGKTGTTDDVVDLWMVGFTPKYVGSVWLGFDEPDNLSQVLGRQMLSSYFPPLIWKDMMDHAHEGLELTDFERPDTIIEQTICIKSGKRPGPHCPSNMQRRELFIQGNEPRDECDLHVEVEVCSEHPDLLYDPACAEAGSPEKRVFLDRDEVEPVQDHDGVTLPMPWDMDDRPPEETCVEVHGEAEPDPHGPDFDDDIDIDDLPVASAELMIRASGFEPTTLRVPAKSKVELTIINDESEDHRLVIHGFGINAFIPAEETMTITIITPDQRGTYHMYCSLQDIHGRLTVDAQP